MQNTTSQPALLTVLCYRSFRHLWFAQIFSQLALNMLLFVLALLIYQTTGSNAAVSGLFLAYGIPAAFFGLVAGVVVDRLDKKAVLLFCDTVRAGMILVLPGLIAKPAAIYLFVFFNALVNQFYIPAEAPTIPRLVSPQHLVSANSFFSFTYYSSMALGFVLSGPLLRLLGSQGALWFLAVMFAVAAVNIWKIPADGSQDRQTLRKILRSDVFYILQRVLADLRQGLLYVSSSPKLLDALFLLTGTQVILAVLGTLGPGFADRVLHIDVRDASLVIAGPTIIGIVLGAIWVGSIGYRFAAANLIRIGILSAGILLMIISITVVLVNIPILALLLFFCLGVANSLLDVPANSILQSQAQGELRGRVYGMLTAAVGGIGILPVVTSGILADMIGENNVVLILGLLVVSYGIWRMRYNKI